MSIATKPTRPSLPPALNAEVRGLHDRQVRLRRYTLGLAAAAVVAAVGVVVAWIALGWAALPTHLTEVALPYEVTRNTVQGSPGDVADPRQAIEGMVQQFLDSTAVKMVALVIMVASGGVAVATANFRMAIGGLIAGLNLLIMPSVISALADDPAPTVSSKDSRSSIFITALVDEPAPTASSNDSRGSIQSLANKGQFDLLDTLLGSHYTPMSRALVLAQTALVRAGKNLSGMPEKQRIVVMQTATAMSGNPEEGAFAALPDATAYLIDMAAYGETRTQRATAFVDRMRSRAAWAGFAGSWLATITAALVAACVSVGALSSVVGRRFNRIQDLLKPA